MVNYLNITLDFPQDNPPRLRHTPCYAGWLARATTAEPVSLNVLREPFIAWAAKDRRNAFGAI